MDQKKQKLPGVAITLLILLGVRAFAQLATAVLAGGSASIIYLLLGVVYSTAVFGVFKRKKWAPILIIVIGVVDGVAAIAALATSQAMGAILMDAILIILAIYDRKYILAGRKKKRVETSSIKG